ncbi:sugar ABC transporter permease [Ponticoccus sp. SC2-23]|uniref:carbohydrate ABC transporter permease n=1 Tax=Alexandriicola marinus TaxID=2081710 RepID=UPI000FD788E8|nr:sugar ABC transporter permease [Alexandriicola marinus]MBM1218967.1 sugar ABC transporter permease [Ponticoccus sp. SC6-9]MBM1223961.1 sugar ABC transporter permease [Ponticoccus sp. SC6-15]MBM1230260.1 sugar ABC transporter permease [Ponticoccus sp. SC6-38]MBM1232927.1 sugar ABC transporter permease [Ponticoccus sp. SC6-45]MBM1237123.1 sugar ABC transporter permease [Ponticoccus sp. SC6-49]MBM1241938.1 sugar ABC transporter permease [Ponticoccus sp. SC2-64]MBM1246451.1 sugar ABC transpor
MTEITPPKGTGPLARREARLAWGLLLPTITAVSLVVILPLLAIFWISVKPVTLADLRPPEVTMREDLRGNPEVAGDEATLRYRLRNSSQAQPILGVGFTDTLPEGLVIGELPETCVIEAGVLTCEFGDWDPGARETIEIPVIVEQSYFDAGLGPRDDPAVVRGDASNVLTNATFTFENFARIFDGREFWSVLWVTLFYTVFGTIGALVFGLFAALLLNKSFRGQGILRGLYLFPYVAPVIAVAFAWILLFDPFSGSANALLIQMGVTDEAINFFGERPLALITVTVFEIWRYFPLSFLFILARMQSIDNDMYEAADMDGASPFQQFWYLSMPQLLGILSVLFLLRFIWTFNKFDDIFLLTGGNAGTRTLTVNVYEQAFALSNLGAGAAVAVVIFACLLTFSIFFLKFISREEGL